MKYGTVRLPCNCKHEMQDKMFGNGVRVHNATAKQDKDFIDVRCTVCGNVKRTNPERVK